VTLTNAFGTSQVTEVFVVEAEVRKIYIYLPIINKP
jgi:hypothetical protein